MQAAFWENVTQSMQRKEKEELLFILERLSDQAIAFNNREKERK